MLSKPSVLSSGDKTNRELSRAIDIDERAISYYLNTLILQGYVIKHYPLTGAKTNIKQVHYKLNDPLLRFWFRFIYPYGSAIHQLGQINAFSNLIKPYLESFFSSGYKTLCREALRLLYHKEELACGYEIGEYWDEDIEIDIVGYRNDSVIDICECKWGKISSIPRLVHDLNTKISRYPNKDGKRINCRLFLRSTEKQTKNADIKTHLLSDLYRLG
jgi:hypothetical protein